MKAVDLYARVRRACHVEGMSQRQAARVFGIDPKTVAKMLRFSVPPGYRRSKPPARPKLDAFTGASGSSLGRAAGLLRRYPGGTEKRSIFATVFGSMPNTRAACRRLIPSTWQARRTRAYRSTAFIPPGLPPSGRKARQRSHFAPPRPDYPPPP